MIALALLVLAQATLEEDPARWKGGATAVEGGREGKALRWEAARADTTLSTDAVAGSAREMGRLTFWLLAEGERERAVVVRLRPREGGLFWRRVTAKPGDWTRIELAPWQFRSEGIPSWEKLASLEFLLRDPPGAIRIDGVRIEKPAAPGPTWLEPGDALAARAFGAGEVRRATTASFRVFTDAPLEAAKLGAALEEFLILFQKTWGLPQEALDYPATLVVTRTRDQYVAFVRKTAAEVYAAAHDDVQAAGFTFEQYSVSSYLEEAGERRPVFFHEVCHQLVHRLLGLRGPSGATWIEEGICYFVQNEFAPQPGLAEQVRRMLESPRRTPLDRFGARLRPEGALNMQAMTLAAMIASDAGRRSAAISALRPDASLKRAVEEALETTLEEFEKRWEAWCRQRWR